MQTKKRKTLLLAVLTVFFLFGLKLYGLSPIPTDINRSMELSERVIREYGGYFTHNSGYLEPKPVLHYEGQILASKKEPAWRRVIDCESNFRHYNKYGNILVGDKHLSYNVYGIAQFQKRTFAWLSELSGKEDLSIWNKDDQIELLRWAIDNGYGYLWSCY